MHRVYMVSHGTESNYKLIIHNKGCYPLDVHLHCDYVPCYSTALCWHVCTSTFNKAMSDCTLLDTKGKLAIQLRNEWKRLPNSVYFHRLQGP